MDCKECLERLYAFLDQELEAVDFDAVKVHLKECGDCGEDFRFEARFLTIVRDCGTSDVAPAELRERVIRRLRDMTPPTL
jgi:mycothiol system anti-sigma-R factor